MLIGCAAVATDEIAQGSQFEGMRLAAVRTQADLAQLNKPITVVASSESLLLSAIERTKLYARPCGAVEEFVALVGLCLLGAMKDAGFAFSEDESKRFDEWEGQFALESR